MPANRTFLGWNSPLLDLAARRLLDRDGGTRIIDLSRLVVIVPTNHSGRRLREHLAQAAAKRQAAVLPPLVTTPEAFLTCQAQTAKMADHFLCLAIWACLLRDEDLAEYPDLFPMDPGDRDYRWALGAADMLCNLQESLAEAGLGIEEAAAHPDLDEPERWAQLHRLEVKLFSRLEEFGLDSVTGARLRAAREAQVPRETERLIIIGTPDPSSLAINLLERIAQEIPVEVWVHAPAAMAHMFDDWGGPIAALWADNRLNIEDRCLSLVGTPGDQAKEALRVLDNWGVSASQVAIGTPSREVIPGLEQALAARGVAAHDPGGRPLANHPVVGLLARLAHLADEGSYEALAACFRQPDYLRLLSRLDPAFRPDACLAELDSFQNQHLPQTLDDLLDRLASAQAGPFDNLHHACRCAAKHVAGLNERGFGDDIIDLLAAVYGDWEIDLGSPEGRHFSAAAEAALELLERLFDPVVEKLRLDLTDRIALLEHALGSLSFYPERDPGAVDLLGWLELQWEDAPALIVTGMNDGKVPDAVVGHPFLPDSLRTALGLRNNDTRLARDAYVLTALLNSGRARGRVHLIAGKTTATGDPLKPSRLFFMCPDDDLTGRALRLFGPVEQASPTEPRTLDWKLRPTAGPLPATFRVTEFSSYLACPFRYYLKRCLSMASNDDRRSEMDAFQFGNLCHKALEDFGRNEDLRDSTDVAAIAAFLHARAWEMLVEWFGIRPTVPVLIQFQSVRQRLSAAAAQQALERAAGWRIIRTEYQLGQGHGVRFHGSVIRGTVDRIDRHEDGRIRVLDYKSSDTPRPPAAAHLANPAEDTPEFALTSYQSDPKRWTDLQLPLYRHFLDSEFGQGITCGYFNLPRAVGKTGVVVWDELDSAMTNAAVRCAAGVIDCCRQARFWPPARRVAWDDFEELFFDEAITSVDQDYFLNLLGSLQVGGE